MDNTNKYQKKLNKYVKKKVENNIKEFIASHQIVQPRGCGKSSLMIKNIFEILEQLGTLQSKGYYRWIRKIVRNNIKKGVIEL